MTFFTTWNSISPSVELFDSIFAGLAPPQKMGETFPKAQITAQEDGHQVEIALPGVPKDLVEIQVKKNVMTVSYQQDEKTKSLVSASSFTKSWTLPNHADIDSITATSKDGVLSITVPTKKEAQKLTRNVEIN